MLSIKLKISWGIFKGLIKKQTKKIDFWYSDEFPYIISLLNYLINKKSHIEDNSSITDHNDIDQYIEHLSSGKRLPEASIAKLCEKAKEVLSEESNIVFLQAPMTIVGRISGQLDDLIEIFNVIGKPPAILLSILKK